MLYVRIDTIYNFYCVGKAVFGVCDHGLEVCDNVVNVKDAEWRQKTTSRIDERAYGGFSLGWQPWIADSAIVHAAGTEDAA